MSFDVEEFRSHFPILKEQVNGHPLAYFDSGASSLKPTEVAERIYNYYLRESSNIHRGAHTLSRRGTERYESVRDLVRDFIHADSSDEIIFTRGVTESVNLFMYSHCMENMSEGDVVLLSPFEHHSNIVPWHLLSEKRGCKIEVLPINENGVVDIGKMEALFSTGQVKLVSLLMYSNVTGVRLDIETVLECARKHKVLSFVDAAQSVLYESIDVQKLDCDFLTFSGHKMLGPYGIGILYGKKDLLEAMTPFHGGGSMISQVNWGSVVYQNTPHKFEAGTPSIADVLGLGAAIELINKYSFDDWVRHEEDLVQQLETFLKKDPRVQLFTPDAKRCGIVSFGYEGAHASDVGEILDQMGVAVRSGHHCAQPLMKTMGVSGTVRLSLGPYNNEDDVQLFCRAFKKVQELL